MELYTMKDRVDFPGLMSEFDVNKSCTSATFILGSLFLYFINLVLDFQSCMVIFSSSIRKFI